MLRDLSKLIDDEDSEGGDGDQLQKDLRQAAQQLWRAQFIYENDWGMKTSYEVLRRHTMPRVSLLAVNALVLLYLIKVVLDRQRKPKSSPVAPDTASSRS